MRVLHPRTSSLPNKTFVPLQLHVCTYRIKVVGGKSVCMCASASVRVRVCTCALASVYISGCARVFILAVFINVENVIFSNWNILLKELTQISNAYLQMGKTSWFCRCQMAQLTGAFVPSSETCHGITADSISDRSDEVLHRQSCFPLLISND